MIELLIRSGAYLALRSTKRHELLQRALLRFAICCHVPWERERRRRGRGRLGRLRRAEFASCSPTRMTCYSCVLWRPFICTKLFRF